MGIGNNMAFTNGVTRPHKPRKKTHGRTKNELVTVLLTVYARWLADHPDSTEAFTLRAYDAYTRGDEPTSQAMRKRFGSWSNTARLIPDGRVFVNKKQRRQYMVELMYYLLVTIARNNDCDMHNVTISMFNEYRRHNPHITAWEVFADTIVGARLWTELRDKTIREIEE